MHELHAKRGTIGPPKDRQHLRYGGIFKAEHHVEKDRPIMVLRCKTIGFGRQFVIIFLCPGKTERIQIRMQVPTHPESTNHHDGADRIACRAVNLIIAQQLSGLMGFFLQPTRNMLLNLAPIAIQR